MQRDIENLEDEVPDEFEEEKSVAELCDAPRVPQKCNKRGQAFLDHWIDGLKREDASKTAKVQDSTRRYVGSTRYDINSYAGGPATIRDVGVIEKRKVR